MCVLLDSASLTHGGQSTSSSASLTLCKSTTILDQLLNNYVLVLGFTVALIRWLIFLCSKPSPPLGSTNVMCVFTYICMYLLSCESWICHKYTPFCGVWLWICICLIHMPNVRLMCSPCNFSRRIATTYLYNSLFNLVFGPLGTPSSTLRKAN